MSGPFPRPPAGRPISALFKNLWPPSRRRAKLLIETQERLRKERELSNQRRCHLWQLPDELILRIVANLQLVPAVCLKTTCRRLYTAVEVSPRIPRSYLSSHDLYTIRNFMLLDRYYQYCTAEAQGIVLTRRACSSCRSTHRTAAFSEAQLLVHPSERVCQNAERWVVLCEHQAYTFAQLQALRHKMNDRHIPTVFPYEEDFICPDHPYRCRSYLTVASETRFRSLWDINQVSMFHSETLMLIPSCEPTPLLSVRAMVRDRQIQLCPHLSTSSEPFIKLLDEVHVLNSDANRRLDMPCLHQPPGCRLSFILRRWPIRCNWPHSTKYPGQMDTINLTWNVRYSLSQAAGARDWLAVSQTRSCAEEMMSQMSAREEGLRAIDWDKRHERAEGREEHPEPRSVGKGAGAWKAIECMDGY